MQTCVQKTFEKSLGVQSKRISSRHQRIFFNDRKIRSSQTQLSIHRTNKTERLVTLHSNQSADDHPPPRVREVQRHWHPPEPLNSKSDTMNMAGSSTTQEKTPTHPPGLLNTFAHEVGLMPRLSPSQETNENQCLRGTCLRLP